MPPTPHFLSADAAQLQLNGSSPQGLPPLDGLLLWLPTFPAVDLRRAGCSERCLSPGRLSLAAVLCSLGTRSWPYGSMTQCKGGALGFWGTDLIFKALKMGPGNQYLPFP